MKISSLSDEQMAGSYGNAFMMWYIRQVISFGIEITVELI
jgi:hypothetical protein